MAMCLNSSAYCGCGRNSCRPQTDYAACYHETSTGTVVAWLSSGGGRLCLWASGRRQGLATSLTREYCSSATAGRTTTKNSQKEFPISSRVRVIADSGKFPWRAAYCASSEAGRSNSATTTFSSVILPFCGERRGGGRWSGGGKEGRGGSRAQDERRREGGKRRRSATWCRGASDWQLSVVAIAPGENVFGRVSFPYITLQPWQRTGCGGSSSHRQIAAVTSGLSERTGHLVRRPYLYSLGQVSTLRCKYHCADHGVEHCERRGEPLSVSGSATRPALRLLDLVLEGGVSSCSSSYRLIGVSGSATRPGVVGTDLSERRSNPLCSWSGKRRASWGRGRRGKSLLLNMEDDSMRQVTSMEEPCSSRCLEMAAAMAAPVATNAFLWDHLPIVLAALCVLWMTWLLIRFFTADADLTLLGKGPPPPRAFEDKVVWIVGASQGLGEELAHRFCLLGAKLILSARRETELERVKASCSGKHAQDGIAILPFDVAGKSDAIDSAVKHATNMFGVIDFVVLNAAYTRTKCKAYEFDDALLEGTFGVNVLGPIYIARAILPHMLEQKSGHFVVISSAGGKVPSPTQALYSASKFAVQGYFRSLDYEFQKEGVGATVVCPGPVKTSDVKPTKEKRISKERCAELIVAAAGHKLPEAWISLFPILQIMYIVQYLPALGHYLLCKVGPGRVQALKEGGESVYSAKLLFSSSKSSKSN
ncbi:hypothetical protein CBR_g30337 [Chara braunii]|uniref:Uncharacterized protein n=1 Tax=Chara braunii TaxID=69332 RepID=A0A388JXD9_CHABU|nr:hypothetical protein CBR_g30337 [Chara braunii]|eukprot:GBG62383.1 hypothetical protein CBR_g30337 [Chara braunii]